ncbi:TPA: hypothetical protein N2D99_002289 [Clostridium botulinum]|nr:hypothetical protein [Clostridium botulinum]
MTKKEGEDIKLNIEELLKLFKEKFKKEIKNIDWNSIYCDCDILKSIPEYIQIIKISDQTGNKKIISEILKIERVILKENKLTKIISDGEINYYAKKGEVYDSDGNIIGDMFEKKLDDEDLFCAYIGDEIYQIMKKNIQRKIQEKYNKSY